METPENAKQKNLKYRQVQLTAGSIKLPVCVLYAVGLYVRTRRIPKRKLVQLYKVDKKTFNKWLEFFCDDLVPNLFDYKRRRTITLLEFLSITLRLGNPGHYPILSKKEIIKQSEGTYYTLKGCVTAYNAKFGLTAEAYLSLKKFPPSISRLLLEHYG